MPTPLRDARRILIVRMGAMGDVLHALPAVALLRRRLPDAELTWAVEPAWAPLVEAAADPIERIPLKRWRRRLFQGETRREIRETTARLRAARFDAAIDLQGLIKSAAVARLSRPGRLIGFDRTQLREPLAARLYHETIYVNRRHVVDRNLGLVRTLLEDFEPAAAEFPLPEGVRSPQLPDGPFLLAAPFAGWRSKEWPAERYAELAALAWRERRLPLVLDCAPADESAVRAIAEQAPDGACRVHVSSLPELIAATRAAAAVLGVDSGPLHLAAALDAPGVALFGPTDPDRNGPYGSSLDVLRQPGAATSYKRENRYAASMLALDVPRVWRALCEKLNAARPRLEVVTASTPSAS